MESVRRSDGLRVRLWEWVFRPRRTRRMVAARNRLVAMRADEVLGRRARVDDVPAARLYGDMGMEAEAEAIRREHRGRRSS